MRYQLLEADKLNYVSVFLLNEIINFQHYFPIKLEGEDVYLADTLDRMFKNGLLDIDNGHFVPTEAGRDVLVNFFGRYEEYLRVFDIFCAVDLERGEFAFERVNDMTLTDEQWVSHLNDSRFSDVRIAVADFKGINPTEIVFMSFLIEGKLSINRDRWQWYLTSDMPWREVLDICNSAIDIDYLMVDGVLENIVRAGSDLSLRLIRNYEETVKANQTEEIIETIEETTETEYVEVVELSNHGYSYWEPYSDPYYLSPVWSVPIVVWV